MKNIYTERSKLQREGIIMRRLASSKETKIEKAFEIRKHQEEQYKKWQFYDGFIKAKDRMKTKETEPCTE